MRVAIVLAAAVAGAALFAALHPAPRDAYEAAGTIVVPVPADGPAELSARTRQAAELLRQPNLVAEALERSLQSAEPASALRRLDVEPRPEAGIVGYSVRAATAATARRLAEELGRVAVEALQRGRSSSERFGLRIVGDFEVDHDGWAAAGSTEGLAAIGVVPDGRYGGGALRVLCDVAAGCGAARVLPGRFPQGRPVTLSAWVRGRQPSRVALVVSSAENADRELLRADVRREWRRLAVRWRPQRDETRVSLAVNNAGPGRADVDVDGVVLVSDGSTLTPAGERELFRERGFAYAAPVRVVGSRTGGTLTWALMGFGGGFVVGLAAVLGWSLASRRRKGLSASRRDATRP